MFYRNGCNKNRRTAYDFHGVASFGTCEANSTFISILDNSTQQYLGGQTNSCATIKAKT